MQPGFQIPSLDGIRGIAVLLVVASHSGYRWASAALGVNVFFFLSGFLITTLLRREHGKTGVISFKNFYIRRTLRIFPPFYLSLIAVCVMVATGVLVSRSNTGIALAQFFHMSNYAHVTTLRLLPGTEMMWSLSVEEHFYLLFPALFAVLITLKPRTAFHIMAAICLAILSWRTIAVATHTIPTYWAYDASDCRMDSVLWGCIMAMFVNPVIDNPDDKRRVAILDRPGVGWAAIVLLVASQLFQKYDAYYFGPRFTIQCLLFFPIFVMAINHATKFPMVLLNRQPLVWVGTISYGLYLYHHVIIEVLKQHTTLKKVPLLGVTLVIALPLCWASFKLMEQPMGRLRKKFNA